VTETARSARHERAFAQHHRRGEKPGVHSGPQTTSMSIASSAVGSVSVDSAEVDRAVARLAGRQHGVVARRQLDGLGMTPGSIKARMRHGGLQSVHRGVYAVGHCSLTVEGRWTSAVLAFGPHAVLSHRSAGHLWGLVPRARIRPEVTRPGFVRGRPFLVVRGHFYEIDCFWEELRVAIELDGGGAHGTTRAFQTDRERDRILLAEGNRTARITWDHLQETPTELADDLRRILTPYPSPNGPGALRPLPPR
jgi:hypothetical protein